ncbi:MAG: nucleotidyltransferase family protein [Defluviitaleaceae bacterium]|nr:nucleotidyltransferase family protein [Defluviitaleaceae bacterium]
MQTDGGLAIGVIAEYNPFHNGHLFHLEEAKRMTGAHSVVAVIGGNFTQRGEPALCDKRRRCEMALRCGADLVVELPFIYACAGASYFACAAARILEASGIVGYCCFGSETGDMQTIANAAAALADESGEFKKNLRKKLGEGISFASARAAALEETCGIPKIFMTRPNDILAVEYVRALNGLSSKIEPVAVRRAEYGFNARALRGLVYDGRISEAKNYMPESAFEILRQAAENGETARPDAFFQAIAYLLRTMPPERVRTRAEFSEGLENRFIRFCEGAGSLDELLKTVKTKRFTLTRLKRAANNLLLDIGADELREAKLAGPPYIRVLGFKRESARLLSKLRERAALPVVVNLKHAAAQLNGGALRLLEREIAVADIYSLAYRRPKKIGYEYSVPLVIL